MAVVRGRCFYIPFHGTYFSFQEKLGSEVAYVVCLEEDLRGV